MITADFLANVESTVLKIGEIALLTLLLAQLLKKEFDKLFRRRKTPR